MLTGRNSRSHILRKKALGKCDIEMPYRVPESRLFVMGDSRSVSVDSRNTDSGLCGRGADYRQDCSSHMALERIWRGSINPMLLLRLTLLFSGRRA